MGFAVERLVVSDEVRVELERRANAHTSTQREARRARVILGCVDGVALRQIAVSVGMDQHMVGEWRRRFAADGIDGLDDKPRSGRPRRITHDERLQLAALATSEKDDTDPVPAWTHEDLADRLNDDGVKISPSQVGRILRSMHLGDNGVVVRDVVTAEPSDHRPMAA